MTVDKHRREARPPQPLKVGACDWCGKGVARGRSYCNQECRVKYNNLLAKQGKAVMQMLKIWRVYRGRKGTPGEGMIGEIANRVDQMIAEDRQRKEDIRVHTSD